MRRFIRYSLLLALILGGVWLLTPPPVMPGTQSADGRAFRLVAITDNDRPVYFSVPRWRVLLEPLRPWGRMPGLTDQRLVFWYASEPTTRWEMEALGEHGCPAEETREGSNHPLFGPPAALHGLPVGYARRSRTLTLRFFRSAGTAGTGQEIEFTIPNPRFDEFPQWVPEPLPGRRQAGDLKFLLTEFGPDPEGGEHAYRLRVEALRNEQPLPGWAVSSVTLTDATGYWRSRPLSSDWRPVPGDYRFSAALCPAEDAWKVAVTLVRVAPELFAPEELVTFADVPISGPDVEQLPLQRTATRDDFTIELQALERSRWQAGRPQVVWRSQKRGAGHPPLEVLLIDARDDRGRPCLTVAANVLDPPADAKSLNLTFAIQQPVTVEFLAAPQRAAAGGEGR